MATDMDDTEDSDALPSPNDGDVLDFEEEDEIEADSFDDKDEQ
jgi:hypothetical protein